MSEACETLRGMSTLSSTEFRSNGHVVEAVTDDADNYHALALTLAGRAPVDLTRAEALDLMHTIRRALMHMPEEVA